MKWLTRWINRLRKIGPAPKTTRRRRVNIDETVAAEWNLGTHRAADISRATGIRRETVERSLRRLAAAYPLLYQMWDEEGHHAESLGKESRGHPEGQPVDAEVGGVRAGDDPASEVGRPEARHAHVGEEGR